MNSPKLKIKDREYKTLPVPNLNILIVHITDSFKEKEEGKSEIQSRKKRQNCRERYKDNSQGGYTNEKDVQA